MRALKEFNDNQTFILTVIDVFSRFAFAKSLPNKSRVSVLKAVKDILYESGRKPDKIQTDMGHEFTNKNFKSVMAKENVQLIITDSAMKASLVERLNRTIKERKWRYFTHANTFRYV